MRKRTKHIITTFFLFCVITSHTVVFAEDVIIDGNQALYTNEDIGYSAKLPTDSYLFFDETVYYHGKELDTTELNISDEDLKTIFERMKISGALFYCLDQDFTYEISCSIMPCKPNNHWDAFCEEIKNGTVTSSDFKNDEINNELNKRYGEYLDESANTLIADYFDNAILSSDKINGYSYMITKYQGQEPNSYVLQYATMVGSSEFIFKFLQYSGNPNNASLERFIQIINSSNLPQKAKQPSNTYTSSIPEQTTVANSILIRLAVFLAIITIIYGIRFLINRNHKIEEPVSWNPEIDYEEIPFSNSLKLREHILQDSYNLSFLFRNTALSISKIKKPYLTFGFLSMWIIGVVLPIIESILTSNWWILIFIPVGLLIPSYSRRIKSWTQVIPITIGTIFSNPIVFYLCINFVIVRSIYDLWYCYVLRTAGEVICSNDKLFSEAWNDTAFAIIVDGEPYFHGKLVQQGECINSTLLSSEKTISEDLPPSDSDENITNTLEQDIPPSHPSNQNTIIDCYPHEKNKIVSPHKNPPLPPVSLEKTIQFCNQCGQKVEEGYRFCLKCGASIEHKNPVEKAQSENTAQEQYSMPNVKIHEPAGAKQLSDEDIKQMRYWKQLLNDGIITEDEFNDKKKIILGD